MGREHASIIDVAVAAGVSPATVSRALRGLPHVSAETRRRVEAAAAELDYVASPAGTGLASGRTRTVGVVVPLASRWFFSQVLAAAEAVLRRGGYDVLLYNLVDAEDKAQFFTQMPVRRKVDALLVVSCGLSEEDVAALVALRTPVVTIGLGNLPFSTVRIDETVATAQAAHHLERLGHRSIVMISALEDDDLAFATASQRRTAFRRALHPDTRLEHVVAGMWGAEGGAAAMRTVIDRLSGRSGRLGTTDPPTAVFAEYDEMAFGVLYALRSSGIHVPEELSVIGFDDHELAEVVELSTVSQPVREQGDLAARLVLDHLQGGLTEPVDVVLETRLVPRRSTGPAPGRSRAKAAPAGSAEMVES